MLLEEANQIIKGEVLCPPQVSVSMCVVTTSKAESPVLASLPQASQWTSPG